MASPLARFPLLLPPVPRWQGGLFFLCGGGGWWLSFHAALSTPSSSSAPSIMVILLFGAIILLSCFTVTPVMQRAELLLLAATGGLLAGAAVAALFVVSLFTHTHDLPSHAVLLGMLFVLFSSLALLYGVTGRPFAMLRAFWGNTMGEVSSSEIETLLRGVALEAQRRTPALMDGFDVVYATASLMSPLAFPGALATILSPWNAWFVGVPGTGEVDKANERMVAHLHHALAWRQAPNAFVRLTIPPLSAHQRLALAQPTGGRAQVSFATA